MWKYFSKAIGGLVVSAIVVGIVLLCMLGDWSLLISGANPDPPAAPGEPQITNHEPPDTNEPVQPRAEPNEPPIVLEPLEEPAAEPDPNRPALVSNVFLDTDLRQALHDIGRQVGVIIVPDETVIGLVTCTLEEVPLKKALQIVLAGTSYVVKKTPDYYLVCSADPTSPAFGVVSETRLMKLNHIKADAALKLLSTGLA